MALQGFQPDSSVFTAFWRYQEIVNSVVSTENYVNFGLIKWFKTLRGAAPKIYFWFNPKEQNDDPDLVLDDGAAAALLADLDAIWTGIGSTTGFQPDSAIDTGFWRYQYTNALNQVTNELYLNFGAVKWVKSVRVPVNAPGGRTDQVSLWFNNKDQDRNPDLILDDGPSLKLLTDFDTIWAN